ncbi:PREDICTED: uncharacterized protein LOC107192638 [Dufourea novaeangliae]|uniref:uncharacterized protein LOC107192638 n=1 Tax=Dufourea novaeangliae TaxID=178035 RepID=UPI0007675D29|nr:PREDICTED: uncharacterized protein LOC107192638 [Dufourea novaeangliae]
MNRLQQVNNMRADNASAQDNKQEMVHIDHRPKLNHDETKSSITDLFPWIIEFRKMCRHIYMEKSMASLMEVMQFYARNVSMSVTECYTRPLRAAKLKDSISETLLLFMYIYRELPEDCNRSIYLNNMSDLLALYIDMELKASKKSKEEHKNISARLISCLYIYLEHSTQYLLDTLIKIQFMCRNYHHILDPIIRKIMKNIPPHPESSTMYVRYFLVYRLWRKVTGDMIVRNQITATAFASLGPVPSMFSPCILEEVLPKVPKSQPNSVKALLQLKFDVKRHCELFVRYCGEKEKGDVYQKKDEPATAIDSSNRINLQTVFVEYPEDIACKDIDSIEYNINSIISDKNKQNESISLLKTFKSINLEQSSSFKCLGTFSSNVSTKHAMPKTINSNKGRSRKKCNKSNEIVIIDLTTDIVFEKCVKRRKSRKLAWLEEAKKRIDSKIVKASQKVRNKKNKQESIDTHSSRIVSHQLHDVSELICVTDNIIETENMKKTTLIEIINETTSKLFSRETVSLTKETSCSISSEDVVFKIKSNEGVDDRSKKQTVIKRLTETDTFSEFDAQKRVESLKAVCDLETEYPSVNNTTICTQYDSKDSTVNCSNLNVSNDRLSRRVIPSIIYEETFTTDYTINVEEELNDESHETIRTNMTEDIEDALKRDKFKIKSPKCTNVDNAGNNEFLVQTELETVREAKPSIVDIRESIFGSCSTDKENISNKVNVTCPDENIDINNAHFRNSVDGMTNDKMIVPSGSHLTLEETSRRESNELCNKKMEVKGVCNIVQSEFVVQDSDLQDNIDGLSLLASVSQHVSHLKPEFVVKCDQIKVKDYASLRYACCSQTTDDEAERSDSSNIVSQLLRNQSAEMVNKIVGIYPEDALNKVAFHIEVTSNDLETYNGKTNVKYDIESSIHNLAPIENNTQTAKENTNVILNGETVVLLQKSPNSNLYIINKAVENSKNHNDEEICRLKEKNWVSSTEDCGQFEAVASLDHVPYNTELAAYSKELPYQENKCSVGQGKGIKMELEENFSDSKSYSKKITIPTDMINSSIYQDANVVSKPIDKLKSSLPFSRQNIKQEFNSIPNHLTIPASQHPLHIPTTLPSIYGNTDLCIPYHKHCNSMSCSLQINTNTPIHPHAKTAGPCERSHCSCLNCTYDFVARYRRQYMHPATEGRVSCIEGSPYFLPMPVQNPAVQEHERQKSEAMDKLYDDQLYRKVENSQPGPLEKLDNFEIAEKRLKKDADNMLPLKKRLKAHALAYGELSIKAEKVDNYPAVPMMSIAALETLNGTQNRVKFEHELPPVEKDHDSSVYHYSSNSVGRDYYKDIHVSGAHQSIEKLELKFRSVNDQPNPVCQDSCLRRSFKTPAQRKEMNVSNGTTSFKRLGTESIEQQQETLKTVKKTRSSPRQTRSSKRNVPKVNYSYTDVDPEWNPSGESRRKRRKTSR